jgi:transposase
VAIPLLFPFHRSDILLGPLSGARRCPKVVGYRIGNAVIPTQTRSAARRIGAARRKHTEFEPLPAYAPELNPVEAMWSHAKFAKLANYTPDDADELDAAVRASLNDQSRNNQLKLLLQDRSAKAINEAR